MLKKLRDYLFDTNQEEEIVEKQQIKEEKNDENVVRKLTEEEIVKQRKLERKQNNKDTSVMFVDDVFDKPKPKASAYSSNSEKRFKPKPFISPVYGDLGKKEEEPVEVIENFEEEETRPDFEEIRNKGFVNVSSVTVTTPPKSEQKDTSESKKKSDSAIFDTKEIVNLKKRLQIDDEPGRVSDENVTMEEAYASEDVEYDIYKIKEKAKAEKEGRKMNLLDLLSDD